MAIKKCLSKLFTDTDINVPVTIFSEHKINFNSYAYKQSWYQTIKECLGEILNDDQQPYHFQISLINAKTYTIYCTGNQFMEDFHSLFKCKPPLSLRIDVMENSDNSWIIILKDDL